MNGRPGRRAVEERVPGLREELGLDFVIANGENAADGLGITPKIADALLAAGVDVITLGNHVWRRREIVPYLSGTDRVIRPANLAASSPGRGSTVVAARDGTRVAVINLLGDLFMAPAVAPFEIVDQLVEEAKRETPIIVVDFHAEATSEKVALARHLDGQVTAVFDVVHGHPARALLAANDISSEDELILRRVQLSDGRTRAFVNDQPVSVQVLK